MSSSKGKWIAAALVVVGIAVSILRSCDSSAPTLPIDVVQPNSTSAAAPGQARALPSQGAKDRLHADLARLDSGSISLDSGSVNSVSVPLESTPGLDSSTHYYAVNSRLVTDSFQVEGGARFESGDSISARVSFPGPTFDFELYPGFSFTPQRLPTLGDSSPLLNPFRARYSAFLGTGTRSLISIGAAADLDILDRVRLSGTGLVRIAPTSAEAEVRAYYLF